MLTVRLHDLPENVMAATPALERSDGPAGAAAYRAADQPGLAALRARDPVQGLICDVQCRVLAQYEAVLNKKTVWEEAQRAWGKRLETLFDRLIFDNHDSSSSQMLLLIAHQVREEYYRLGKALQYPV
ncbi:hypothetical protein LNQ03_13180 [Klebsiella pneumoniae subsp. pneumoniae]|nr:hypothetical protein [Klebsiella pneumoniae subsp. pneumoniae]